MPRQLYDHIRFVTEQNRAISHLETPYLSEQRTPLSWIGTDLFGFYNKAATILNPAFTLWEDEPSIPTRTALA